MNQVTYPRDYVMQRLLGNVKTVTETILKSSDNIETIDAVKSLEGQVLYAAVSYFEHKPMHEALREWAKNLNAAHANMRTLNPNLYRKTSEYLEDLKEGAFEYIDWTREDLGVQASPVLMPKGFKSVGAKTRAEKRESFDLWTQELAEQTHSPLIAEHVVAKAAPPPTPTLNVLCNKGVPFAVVEGTARKTRQTALAYVGKDPDVFCDVTVYYAVKKVKL